MNITFLFHIKVQLLSRESLGHLCSYGSGLGKCYWTLIFAQGKGWLQDFTRESHKNNFSLWLQTILYWYQFKRKTWNENSARFLKAWGLTGTLLKPWGKSFKLPLMVISVANSKGCSQRSPKFRKTTLTLLSGQEIGF